MGTGLFTGGDIGQLVAQAVAAVAVLSYSFSVALLLALALGKTLGFRIENADEVAGIDSVLHGEEGYALDRV